MVNDTGNQAGRFDALSQAQPYPMEIPPRSITPAEFWRAFGWVLAVSGIVWCALIALAAWALS